jgi:putative heme-binding domain-containing protein
MRHPSHRRTSAFAILSQALLLTVQAAPVELPSQPAADGPAWIWSQGKATPEAFFEKEFLLNSPPVGATLKVSCDNGCKVFINGKLAAHNEDWNRPTTADAKAHLQSGINKIRVEAKNDGTTAGLAISLEIALPEGTRRWLHTDATWSASPKENEPLAPAQVLKPYGSSPWGKVFEGKPGGGSGAASPAITAGNIKVPEGFKVEQLHVLSEAEGSWCAMCVDPKGRIIASDVNGKMVRITPPPVGGDPKQTVLEPINLEVGHANGMLWAFDALYVMVCREGVYEAGSGVYRVSDTNGDDVLDKVELLRKVAGQGDHGPHALLLTPGGKSITVVCGNSTRLTEIQHHQVPPIWKDDLTLPKITGHGFMLGSGAPAGYIARMSPDGKEWTLISSGLRNEYDAAYNRDGELFTYDADMEWDLTLPWYRPTRVCHLTDGADFGWRSVSGKWPEDYADSLPPVINVGRGSPTGVAFGYGAKFPAKYQNALFIADWTYGKLYAVHLREQGASYSADLEVFAEGKPLPLTDVVVNPKDGALYFGVGSRKGNSALYRVSYAGKESVTEAAPVGNPEAAKLRALRHRLEDSYHASDAESLDLALKNLASPDRFIRFAARTLLEFRDPAQWTAKALSLGEPQSVIQTAMAIARLEKTEHRDALFARLLNLELSKLDTGTRLDVVRALQLVSLRLGDPEGGQRDALLAKLHAAVPATEVRFNQEASQLLVRWNSPLAAEKIFALFQKSASQEEQVSFAACLRLIKTGWPANAREQFFRWFLREEFNKAGNLGKFMADIRKDSIASLSETEKLALQPVLDAKPEARPAPPVASRLFVKNWTTDELVARVEPLMKQPRQPEKGATLFRETGCVACHAFKGEGGAVGPDLTLLGGRFSVREIIESMTEPSKVISDQYGTVNVQLKNGSAHLGRLVNEGPDLIQIQENLFVPSDVRDFSRKDVAKLEVSPISLMPPGLLNTCHPEDVADFVSWLVSGLK